MKQLIAEYSKLNGLERRVMQLIALVNGKVSYTTIEHLSKNSGWKESGKKPIDAKTSRSTMDHLIKRNLLMGSAYSSCDVAAEITDYAIRDSIKTGWFEKICEAIKNAPSDHLYNYGDGLTVRKQRIAFYSGDSDTFLENRKYSAAKYIRFLDPFDRAIYDQLNPIIRSRYVCDSVSREIIAPSGAGELLEIFSSMLENLDPLEKTIHWHSPSQVWRSISRPLLLNRRNLQRA